MLPASPTPADLALWTEFNAFVLSTTRADWIFRGQTMLQAGSARISFGLRPKAGRTDCLGPSGYSRHEEHLVFEAFRRNAARFVEGNGYTQLDWMALAQHHGLPTRLLDWTTNPLVAAWFAVNGGDAASDCEIFAICIPRIVKDRALTEPLAVRHVAFAQTTPRIERVFRQHGVFSIHPDPDSDWDPEADGFPMQKLTIPAANRGFFRRFLAQLGFDHHRLMADIDGVGADLALRYRNGQETAS
jgi:hypothetical protein